MQKISNITSTATSDGLFTNGSVASGVSPTILDAGWFNTVQNELVNIVQSAGLTLDPTNDAQVLAAIKSMFNSGRLLGVKIFTSSGSYTPSAGTSSIIVEAVGGGGGGGGGYSTSSGQSAVGGGGGAGGYGKARFTSGFSSVAVTIGAGGTGGAPNSSTAGSTGGTTSFGSLLVCGGGGGGTFCSNWASPIHTSSAPSGTVSGANICSYSASAGPAGYYANNGWLSGGGASSPFGRGGIQVGSTQVGAAATGYGSGGGGASVSSANSGVAGGAGSAGMVIVWEYA